MAGEVEGVSTEAEVAAKAMVEVEVAGGEVEEIKVDDVGTEIITSRTLSVCDDVFEADNDVDVEASEVHTDAVDESLSVLGDAATGEGEELAGDSGDVAGVAQGVQVSFSGPVVSSNLLFSACLTSASSIALCICTVPVFGESLPSSTIILFLVDD